MALHTTIKEARLMMRLFKTASLLISALFVVQTQAIPIMWTVEGAVSGDFFYDADLNQYSPMNLVQGTHVYTGVVPALSNANGFVSLPSIDLWELTMNFSSPLTNAGGLYSYTYSCQSVAPGSDAACLIFDNGGNFNILYTENLQGVGSVPEPTIITLFLLGFAGLVFLGRMQRVHN